MPARLLTNVVAELAESFGVEERNGRCVKKRTRYSIIKSAKMDSATDRHVSQA